MGTVVEGADGAFEGIIWKGVTVLIEAVADLLGRDTVSDPLAIGALAGALCTAARRAWMSAVTFTVLLMGDRAVSADSGTIAGAIDGVLGFDTFEVPAVGETVTDTGFIGFVVSTGIVTANGGTIFAAGDGVFVVSTGIVAAFSGAVVVARDCILAVGTGIIATHGRTVDGAGGR